MTREHEAPEWGGEGQPFTAEEWKAERTEPFTQGITARELAAHASTEPASEEREELAPRRGEAPPPVPVAETPPPATPGKSRQTQLARVLRIVGLTGVVVAHGGELAMVASSNTWGDTSTAAAMIAARLGWMLLWGVIVIVLTKLLETAGE